jgi:hypothetical protein
MKAIEKIIYPKRKGTFDSKMLNEVLNLEIHKHLQNNKDLKFLNVSKPVKNDDLTVSFFINFV